MSKLARQDRRTRARSPRARRLRQQQQLELDDDARRDVERRASAANAAIAAQVPAAIKSKGTLIVATDAHVRAERVHRRRRPHGHRHGPRPGEGARRSDGAEGQRRQRDLRHDHPRPGRGQIRPRRLVLHRHQGTREDGRLRRPTSPPASPSTRKTSGANPDVKTHRRPLRQDGRRSRRARPRKKKPKRRAKSAPRQARSP